MRQEEIQDYTARITAANKTGLLVVLYDICLTHLQEAESAESYEEMKKSIRFAREDIALLRDTLNYDYSLSRNLASLYRFMDQQLAMVVVRKDKKELPRLQKIVLNLQSAYKELAEKDNGEPLMKNTQKLYAGLTYGRGSCYEVSVQGAGQNRGYLA